MNDVQVVEKTNIENLICEIRGKQVILDSNLAFLYHVDTGNLNRARKRNIKRFPENFAFQITKEEYKNLKCQTGISNIDMRTINRNLPYVYTEEGVAMLASVLHTDIAIEISIKVINAFVAMRKFISTNIIEQKYINNLVLKNDKRLSLVEDTLDKLSKNERVNTIFFEGEIYDAYSKIVDILKTAEKVVIIIDAYADKTILDIIKNLDVKVTLICKTKPLLTKLDIDNYNKQYDNLNITFNDTFHDRYFIIDDTILYHLGTSINHAGSKTFSINKIEDKEVINLLNNKVNRIV